MRLIGLTCFAAVALACSPAAAGCYGYKLIIGKQFVPGSDPDKDKVAEAKYDLRGETYEVIEGANRRVGTIQNFCDSATVVIYESKRPDGSTPNAGKKPEGNPPTEGKKPEGNTLTVASPVEDDGICWLKVAVADVSGVCFRRSTGAVSMQGKIY